VARPTPGWLESPRRGSVALLEVGFATVVGAAAVSALQARPTLVAGLLATLAGAHLARQALRGAPAAAVPREAFLMLTTGVIGYLTEVWGTTHGHWTYAHLPPGHTVPAWVPIAWVLAGVLLHRVDDRVAASVAAPMHRVGIACAAGIFFPWLGEAICIASGVWRYHWPLQIAGVPVLALLLIAWAHLAFALIRGGLTGVSGGTRARTGRVAPS
jgi:hypothetical protein